MFQGAAQLNLDGKSRLAIPAKYREELLDTCAGSLVLTRSEEHTSELQSRRDLVCRLLLEKKQSGQAKNRFFLYKTRS